MSQYYHLGNEVVWNPASGASRLFQRQIAVFEAELDLASGIGSIESDESHIDPVLLRRFVDALIHWSRCNSHPVIRHLSEGFIATVLSLAERAHIEVDRSGSVPTGCRESSPRGSQ